MRATFVVNGIVNIRINAWDMMVGDMGFWPAAIISLIAIVVGTLLVTTFMPLWVGGPFKQILAAAFAMVLGSGVAFAVASIAMAASPQGTIGDLWQVPTMFAAGLLAPLAGLARNPISLVIWLGFTFTVGALARAARETLHRQKREAALSARNEADWSLRG